MTRENLANIRAAAAPVAALVLGIPLLQHHSIEYLTNWKTGAPATWDTAMLLAPWSGWGWSLELEIVAIWMWYERGAARRALAVLATAALLFGPVYLTISGEAAEWEGMQAAAALANRESARIAAGVAEKKATLATYRKNSEARVGWQRQIAEAEQGLAALRAEQKANDRLIIAASGRPWGLAAKAAGWIAIILLCGLANVAAITSVSRRFNAPVQTNEPEPVQPKLQPPDAVQPGSPEPNHSHEPAVPPQNAAPSAGAPPCAPVQPDAAEPVQPFAQPDDLTIKRLQRAIAEAIKKSGLSLNKWCAAHGVNKRDLLWLSKHFERASRGLPSISQNKLRELIVGFLDSEEATQ